MSEELKKRWATAIIAIALVVWGLISKSIVPLYFIAAIVAVVGIWETCNLLGLSLDNFVVGAVSVCLTLAFGAKGNLPC